MRLAHIFILMVAFGTIAHSQNLPSTYDLRSASGQNYVTSVKTQQGGTCWAHGVMAAMEGNLLKTGNWANAGETGEPNLAEYHLDWWNGFNEHFNKDVIPPTGTGLEVHMGGDYRVAAAYMTRGDGAVRDIDGQSYNTFPSYYLSSFHMYYPRHIEWYAMKGNNIQGIDIIKQKIIDYGVMGTCMDYENNFINSSYVHYQPPTSTLDPNHAIAIVGWDDNMVTQAPQPGAWLVKNSWGESWGNNGYFWISYYDKHSCRNPEMGAVSFIDVIPFPYYQVYYHDYHGWRDTKSGVTEAFNAYSATDYEEIVAVSFYTADDSVQYKAVVFGSFQNGTLSDTLSIAQGFINHTGFHTVDLDSTVKLTKGEHFYIYVWLDKGGHPYDRTSDVPVLLGGDSRTIVPSSASPEESYFMDNNQWIDFYTVDSTANFCIKALTAGPLPPKASQPTGALPVYCDPVDTLIVTTQPVAKADSIIWKITPASAGQIGELSDTTAIVVVDNTYDGKITIFAAGANENGSGKWSDPLEFMVFRPISTGTITGTLSPSLYLSAVYEVPNNQDYTYQWSVVNGNVANGQGTHSVEIVWNSLGKGTIEVTASNSYGCLGDTSSLEVTVQKQSSINEPTGEKIAIQPNPAKDIIRVSGLVGDVSAYKVALFDLAGKNVQVKVFDYSHDGLAIALDNVSPGVYFVSIGNDLEYVRRKIIIHK